METFKGTSNNCVLQVTNNIKSFSFQNQLAQKGIITAQQKDELLRKHLEAEQSLKKVHDLQRDTQISHLKDKLADRRKKKLAKLRGQQEQELADVCINYRPHQYTHILDLF